MYTACGSYTLHLGQQGFQYSLHMEAETVREFIANEFDLQYVTCICVYTDTHTYTVHAWQVHPSVLWAYRHYSKKTPVRWIQPLLSWKVICFFSRSVWQCIYQWMSFSCASDCACLCVRAYILIIVCLCLCTQTVMDISNYPLVLTIVRAVVFPPPSLSLNSLFRFLLRKVSTPAC